MLTEEVTRVESAHHNGARESFHGLLDQKRAGHQRVEAARLGAFGQNDVAARQPCVLGRAQQLTPLLFGDRTARQLPTGRRFDALDRVVGVTHQLLQLRRHHRV